MVFCPIIAAVALQAAAADTTDVDIVNRRPSVIVSQLSGGLVPAGCKVEALDESGKIRLRGDARWRQDAVSYIHMFDVKPQIVELAVRVESQIDKTDYRLKLEVPNEQQFSFSENATGLDVTVLPRINGDGTITMFVTANLKGSEKVQTVVRLKQKTFYVFSHGPRGKYSSQGALSKHPSLLDPVLTISPSIKDK